MAQHGNNSMGLLGDEDRLLLMITVMVRSAEQKAKAYPESKAMLSTLREYAASTAGDLNHVWEYLNYADESQDPLGSYGAENVKKLKGIALKYDSQQVFQKLCGGGFKLKSTA